MKYTPELCEMMHKALIVANEALRATEVFMVGQENTPDGLDEIISKIDDLLDRIDDEQETRDGND